MNQSLFFFLAFAISAGAASGPALFNVRDYGAKGDGAALETAAITRAIDACAGAGGGVVYVPPGNYLTGTLILQSHVTLQIEAGATLLGSENPEDYPLRADPWGIEGQIICPLIYAEDARNIALTGRGVIDGRGQVWWKRHRLAHPKNGQPVAVTPSEIDEAKKVNHGRPRLVRFVRCQDVLIEQLHFTNSAFWTISPLFCQFVRVDGVTIQNPVPSPNTDGINPESCQNVQIVNCQIDVGDDCVTLKSGMNEAGRRLGKPDQDITIANCVMMQGHGGVVIGSEMSGGVRNVTVANCVFHGTDIGLRVKSQRGRGGVVENFTACNLSMDNVTHPFVITTFYQGNDQPGDKFEVNEGTPKFHDFLFSNISARGARDAGSITGLREWPVDGVAFSNVHIEAQTGFSCVNAKNIQFHDVDIETAQGPSLTLRACENIDSARLTTRTPHAQTSLVITNAPSAP
ncbi:MAG TPA: glycoside hydrolase family 28 protein [Candidatus Saccharimonadales bacterium]|nr:glycoside hydrolase family 28 protein [Candidatus Saccharimonadales bacterium]